MNKSLFHILFSLLITTSSWAQIQKSFTTNWEPGIVQDASKAMGSSASRPAFSKESKEESLRPSAFHRLSRENIEVSETWVDQNIADPSSVRLENLRYEALTTEELNKLNKSAVPSQLTYKIETSRGRDQLYTTLTYSPIINRNGTYSKIVSFNLNYNYNPSNRTTYNASNYTIEANSIFASGTWYKFKVEKSGIHKIDGNFLSRIGIDLQNVTPSQIKIYGHGGDALPLANEANAPIDPPQIALKVVANSSSRFDNSDYILFYAEGTRTYNEENDSHINPYSDESYYYITVEGEPGLRIQNMQEPSGNASEIITTYHSAQFHEEDDFSPAKVGRRWFGNRFDIQNQQNFDFNFSDIVLGSEYTVTIKTGAVSSSSTSMRIDLNGQENHMLTYSPINDPVFLVTRDLEETLAASSNNFQVTMQYNNNGNPSSTAYIDYIRIEALEHLKGKNEQFLFNNKEVKNMFGIGEYRMSNAQNISEVWDITDWQNIQSKQNNGSSNLQWKTNLGETRQYIAVHANDYYEPIAAENPMVRNQNIKGTILRDSQGNFKDIDYLIITSPKLVQPAIRLANHHIAVNNLNVKVLTTDDIYQEFSSGKQDIAAIRNLVRYVYNNASTPGNRVKYLALFGDTSVDYKTRWENNNNIVPTFHTVQSTSNYSSYMSDDFFGMLDNNEGSMAPSDKLDLAVGRIIADEVSLANAMVDKAINYQKEASFGSWRNNIITISDDVDKTYEFESIQRTLNNLSDEISEKKPAFNVKKILADSYVQQTSAGGNRYPDVNKAITEAIEVGGLVVNYFGHGGEDGLAHEFIYTQNDANNLNNTNRYPLFITVTCEFTKFDYPQRITAGELTYWNPRGGAVSLITTTRAISVSLGVEFNLIMTPEIFGYDTFDYNTPAEALRRSKNVIGDRLRRVVFYIGDPAMHLAQAKPSVALTQINDTPISNASNTPIEALGKVKLSGIVTDENGNQLSNYNGILETKVFDKEIDRTTLGNDGTRNSAGELLILDFITLGEIIFNGQATVNNGAFDIEFIAPRDIRSELGNGRISFYTKRDGVLEDRTGYNNSIQVGGINENAADDSQGPEIQLYFNDETFAPGATTNNSPILIAKLEDDSGINTSSGIGHDILAFLDGDESNPIKLNEYYQSDVDDYTKGSLQYQFKDLEEGLHTLKLKAWDVYNNSSTSEIEFVVAENDNLEITRVLNYPNPFVNYTEFWFEHNRPYEPLDVQVQVLTVTGKIVWSTNQLITTDGFLSRDIIWDGRDDFGDRIGKGVYIYKISVKSTLTNQRTEKFEKLVIL
ncbi:MAG TPA: type IX secretion system sortase PorU [Flavobacteriaceae bacterium]|nr:type IX secretion system sortase PorU [Flavobacteriaceae bacterium]